MGVHACPGELRFGGQRAPGRPSQLGAGMARLHLHRAFRAPREWGEQFCPHVLHPPLPGRPRLPRQEYFDRAGIPAARARELLEGTRLSFRRAAWIRRSRRERKQQQDETYGVDASEGQREIKPGCHAPTGNPPARRLKQSVPRTVESTQTGEQEQRQHVIRRSDCSEDSMSRVRQPRGQKKQKHQMGVVFEDPDGHHAKSEEQGRPAQEPRRRPTPLAKPPDQPGCGQENQAGSNRPSGKGDVLKSEERHAGRERDATFCHMDEMRDHPPGVGIAARQIARRESA